MRIRKLTGGVFYRPVKTPAGPKGWCAEIRWEEYNPRGRKGILTRSNWRAKEIIMQDKNEKQIRKDFQETWDKLSENLQHGNT